MRVSNTLTGSTGPSGTTTTHDFTLNGAQVGDIILFNEGMSWTNNSAPLTSVFSTPTGSVDTWTLSESAIYYDAGLDLYIQHSHAITKVTATSGGQVVCRRTRTWSVSESTDSTYVVVVLRGGTAFTLEASTAYSGSSAFTETVETTVPNSYAGWFVSRLGSSAVDGTASPDASSYNGNYVAFGVGADYLKVETFLFPWGNPTSRSVDYNHAPTNSDAFRTRFEVMAATSEVGTQGGGSDGRGSLIRTRWGVNKASGRGRTSMFVKHQVNDPDWETPWFFGGAPIYIGAAGRALTYLGSKIDRAFYKGPNRLF